MPEFILNDKDTREFQQLPEITQGFIEAMFFTECEGSLADDTFDPENGSALPDEASWLDIGDKNLLDIIEATTKWAEENSIDLYIATGCIVDGIAYDMVRAGNDLWYTSNGHGVGFWDREFHTSDGSINEEIGDRLSEAARAFGETNVFWETTDEDECTGIVYVD